MLELGCGEGNDTDILSRWCYALTATDIRGEQLSHNRQRFPKVHFELVDHAQPLPFADEQFTAIVASLCLHYFSWSKSLEILAEIYRVSCPGALLIGRLNSTKDSHYGACDHPQIEAGLYNVNGQPKRFFSREDVVRMLGADWQLEQLTEKTISKYQYPKVVWEFAARKI